MPGEWPDRGPFILDKMLDSLPAGLQIRPTAPIDCKPHFNANLTATLTRIHLILHLLATLTRHLRKGRMLSLRLELAL